MAIYHQHQVVRRTAKVDLSNAEGRFVTLDSDGASLTTASTKAASVCGCVDCGGEAGQAVDIILPGDARIVGVMTAESAPDVQEGDTLALADNGTVTKSTTGCIVARALAYGTSGHLVAARLIEPADATE